MDPKEFRAHAHELVDWMADYLEGVADLEIRPKTQPGDVLERLPERAPEQGESFSEIFADFESLIVPNMMHWNHPGFFGYFPANHSPPSILAEMLTAAMGAQCMSWSTSPAATELEQAMMCWLGNLTGVPDEMTGVIHDTASTSTLVALLSARERATAHEFGGRGTTHAPLRVYTSAHAHSSVAKAAKLAGYGLENVRLVPTDDAHAMDPSALAGMIEEDLAQGMVPAAVVATIGTTSSTAIDPLPEIGPLCAEYDIWLHVDGAYAGVCGMLFEFDDVFAGLAHADSYVFNPHKWLFINFDCSAYFVRDVEHLRRTFATNPEYLRHAQDDETVNYRDWGIQLGRRFRALKVWFVLRSYGAARLREILREHIAWAADFADWARAHPDLEVVAPHPFGLVCFRALPPQGRDADQYNQALLEALNAHADLFLTHTRLGDDYVLRVSIGQLHTTSEDVARLQRAIDDALPTL